MWMIAGVVLVYLFVLWRIDKQHDDIQREINKEYFEEMGKLK